MLATVLLVGLLAVASATDVWRHKIYNGTTYPGIVAALGLNALGWLLAGAGVADARTLESLGWIGVGRSVLGLAACGGVLLLCFVLFKVGGGDVKMMAMLGAFLGPEQGIEAMLWTFVLGACAALIVLIWRVGPWRLAVGTLRHLAWMLRLGGWTPLSADQRAQLQPPLFLAPSALAAVVIVRFSLAEWLV